MRDVLTILLSFPALSAESERCGLLSKQYYDDINDSSFYGNEKTNQRKHYDEKTNAKTHDQTIVIVSDDEKANSDHEETH